MNDNELLIEKIKRRLLARDKSEPNFFSARETVSGMGAFAK